MSIDFAPQQWEETKPRITVIGVGGAGGNAVNNMINGGLEGVEFVVANTDAQSLQQSLAEQRIQLGVTVTHGLGAGARPDIGRVAAEEALDDILQYLEANNMVFIAAGMGGGTGTGAAPVIARAARERGILTVGVVTKPFQFEGIQRMRLAEAGLQELQQYVDTLIVIPNQNLFRVANEQTTFAAAFNLADEVLHAGVRGVTDLMVSPGLINLDFADIRTVMGEMGKAMMGTGEAEGDNRAIEAAEAAINNPLLDNASIQGARGVLINITGGSDVTLMEVDEAASRICQEVDDDANIIFGTSLSNELEGHMRVAVIATGIEADLARQPVPEPSDKVHVLGFSQRKGGDRPSAGAVGTADYGAPTATVEETEASEQDALAAIAGDAITSETDVTGEGLSIALNSVEQSFENTETEVEPDAPVEVSEPVVVENSPPQRKMVIASSAGGIRAGVVMRKNQPDVVAPDLDESDPTSQPEIVETATTTPSAPMAKPDTGRFGFIPRPAVTPGDTASAGLKKAADPFAVSDVENAGGSGKKRGPSLFERMTGSGKARREMPEANLANVEAEPQRPARPGAEKPAGESRGKEPTFETAPLSVQPVVEIQSIEEDPLEIPAFLRRQAN
ncbi:MAG: cell division protein FtsZ [Proteobacteria bacterium]|nr:cell division protein FtsZ [Pseudomonadota bacterium]MDA1357170.1 cell division protein FtsZ [Pseudomonadota bacterium]